MSRVKTFDATGIAPGGRLYAGDLNSIQDHYADAANFGQTVDVGTVRIGETGLQLSRFGAGEAQITGNLRISGISRPLGGTGLPQLTTAQRDAIALGSRPQGLCIFNTTTARLEINAGSDATPTWQQLIPSGQVANADIVAGAGIAKSKLAALAIVDADVTGPIAVSKLSAGSAGQILGISAGVPTWQAPSSFSSPLTTKGDLYGRGTGGDLRVAVGTDGQVLQADSTQAAGVKWGAPSAVADASTTVKGIVQLVGDLTGTATTPAVAAGAITDTKVAAANKDGAAGTASMRTLGSGSAQACAGNDSRLSDTRTPTDGSVTNVKLATDAVTAAKILDGTIANAEISASAAIEFSKLNYHLGTSPPAAPVDGMMWIFNNYPGVYWTFIYDSSEPTYKWKFIGGPPIAVSIVTDQTFAGTGVGAVDVATVGPQVTGLRAGDWYCETKTIMYASGQTTAGSLGVVLRTSSGTWDGSGTADYEADEYVAGGWATCLIVSDIARGVSASTTIKTMYASSNVGGTVHVNSRQLKIWPIRFI